MRVPGQAGRFVAVFVVVPLLMVCAYLLMSHPSSRKVVARVLLTLALVLLVYELLWICGVLDYK